MTPPTRPLAATRDQPHTPYQRARRPPPYVRRSLGLVPARATASSSIPGLSAVSRVSKRKQPRDLYGLEAALIELAHDDPFLQPHRGSDKRYPAGIART